MAGMEEEGCRPMAGDSLHQERIASINVVKEMKNYQSRIKDWLIACFGESIASDKEERSHRFLEEALELGQSVGLTKSEALELVEYVYNRPIGEKHQEVGGVMITLAAFCLAHNLDMQEEGERELKRVWTKLDVIRAKQASKPKNSPLPQ